MPLQKQNLNLNFSQGLDTKTDPWQVQAGKMLELENTVFNKGGLLQKRNGYGSLASLPDDSSTTLTTFLDNLVAIGNELNALSEDTGTWYNKGTIQPMDVATIPIARTNYSQTTVDTAIASNGLCCGVFTDSLASSSYYQIVDSLTGQIIVSYTLINAAAKLPRVFSLGNYFIITYLITVTGVTHIKYLPIPIFDVENPLTTVDVSSQVKNDHTGYDGYIKNNNLYFAFNGSDGGGAIHIYFLDSTLVLHTPVVISGKVGDFISVTADADVSKNTIWITFATVLISPAYSISVTAYDTSLNLIRAVTVINALAGVFRLTSSAISGTNYVYFEQEDSLIDTFHNIYQQTCPESGSFTAPVLLKASAGIGSKSFYFHENGTIYILAAFNSVTQPSYFLIDQNGNTVAKLAYSNGIGFLTNQILPSIFISGSTVQMGYLFRTQLLLPSKVQGNSTDGIYAQTGANLATFVFNTIQMVPDEIASNLHLTGGFLWMYDGARIVEHGFHVWPDPLVITGFAGTGGGLKAQEYFYQMTYEWTDAQGNIHRSAPSIPMGIDFTGASGTPVTFTSVFSSGVTTFTASSAAGLFVGQRLTDTTTGGNLATGTYITQIVGTSITINTPTTGSSASTPGDTLQTVDTFNINLNLPCLTFTAKQSPNQVRLVLYRWSTDQQVYYQTTSTTMPTLNNSNVTIVPYTDQNNDLVILGNLIIYTEGGVVENIAAPPCSTATLYKSRLIVLDSEDRNLLWYSKQVIEGVPVEMSDLFTIFVAPTISAQGSTGPIKSLSAMDDKLIVFKKDSIYYITGNGPDNTGANNDFSDPIFITSTVGCSNQQSIVFMPQGIMFQSDKGIWLLGRDLSTIYIGAPVEAYNIALVQSAVNVPETNQVRFTLDNGITLMYDYYYNQWGTFMNVPAVSSTIYQSLHTYLNSFGQVFQEDPGSYLDGPKPVLMRFKTAWFNLAGLQGYERAYFFYLLGNYMTPHKLNVQIAYDYTSAPTQSSVIYPINFSPAYGGDPLYGSGSPYGGGTSVEQWRIFLQIQQCESFQMTITEIYDPSFGVQAGAGLTLSGINLVIGIKSGYPRIKPSLSVG